MALETNHHVVQVFPLIAPRGPGIPPYCTTWAGGVVASDLVGSQRDAGPITTEGKVSRKLVSSSAN